MDEAYWQGDSEMMALRKELLDRIIKQEPLDQWLSQHRVEKEPVLEVEASMITLDSVGYHPEDKNFKYYREYSGKELIGFLGSPNLKHSDAVTCAAVSPDGKYIISGSSDNTLKLWDIETGECLKSIPLLWIPMEIKPAPHQPGLFATANANSTVTLFAFSEIIGKH